MDIEEVLKLIDLMEKHGLDEVEVSQGDSQVRLRKSGPVHPSVIAPVHMAAAAPVLPSHAAATTSGQAPAPVDDGTVEITSPMVGTFYHSPAPDADSFVNKGDSVTPDTVVCIIEAMKVMNEIKAEVEGEVVSVLVENGESVEYGQPIIVIRPPASAK